MSHKQYNISQKVNESWEMQIEVKELSKLGQTNGLDNYPHGFGHIGPKKTSPNAIGLFWPKPM
jgi:hypothetical protein